MTATTLLLDERRNSRETFLEQTREVLERQDISRLQMKQEVQGMLPSKYNKGQVTCPVEKESVGWRESPVYGSMKLSTGS